MIPLCCYLPLSFVLNNRTEVLRDGLKNFGVGTHVMEITTRNEKRIYLIFQQELCDPVTVGDYVRVYCHIHGSDHQRSLSINKATGWGHCFNAACDATVLVAEWNRPTAHHLIASSYLRGTLQTQPERGTPPPYQKKTPTVTQPVLLLPTKAPPLWQQEERLALVSLDKEMRLAMLRSQRARAYLLERRIPIRIAQNAGVGYLPAELLAGQG